MKRTELAPVSPKKLAANGGKVYSTFTAKPKPLANLSPKRVAQDKACDDRRAFRKIFKQAPCWWCCRVLGREIHHLFGRNHPLRHHRTGCWWACPKCHKHIEKRADLLPRLIEIKKDQDPDGWNDLVAVDLYHGKAGRVDL